MINSIKIYPIEWTSEKKSTLWDIFSKNSGHN